MNKNNDINNIYDICIIGGGINGAGIANYASALGLKVYLCEKNDYAGQTSSSSTKLIHGGLRYLEFYEFGLVRKSLKERSELEKIANHIIHPLDFILVNNPKVRSKYLVRLGLLLYDLLAGLNSKYKRTKTINLLKNKNGNSLDLNYICEQYNNNKNITGFIYTDLWVDDARLTLLNILAAKNNGANINKNTECLSANYNKADDLWDINLKSKNHEDFNNNQDNHNKLNIKAKLIINTAGPWVNYILEQVINIKPKHNIRLVKGSHIIVNKLYGGDQCYVLQNKDNRIVFAIPYEKKYTLIGTTEEDISELDLNKQLLISSNEKDYLINIANDFFNTKLNINSIVKTYSGVRPLIDEKNSSKTSNTRDYLIDIYNNNLINIYGGKITTYRVLAKEIINILSNNIKTSIKPNYSDNNTIFNAVLPGGDIKYDKFISKYHWLDKELAIRYFNTYGSLADLFLSDCTNMQDLGDNLGACLYTKEVDYLVNHEFASCADDIIWRRTKLGLHMNSSEISSLNKYLSGLIQ